VGTERERVGGFQRAGMGFWVLPYWVNTYRYIYIYIYILYFVGRAGIHPIKIPKSVIRPLSEYLKYPYPCPSVYILTGGRAGERIGQIYRAGRVLRFFAHP
jgi:hypothetical protein